MFVVASKRNVSKVLKSDHLCSLSSILFHDVGERQAYASKYQIHWDCGRDVD